MKNSATLRPLNRSTCKASSYAPKVLQFGSGNFLRAFLDEMIQVMNDEISFEGSVIIVKPTEREDYTDLRTQDGLYHVVNQGYIDGKTISNIKFIDCIVRVIHPYKSWAEYLSSAEIASIRFVFSNTTESGIRVTNNDHSEVPKEFPGKLTKWLFRRFDHFNGASDKGCIFIPCC